MISEERIEHVRRMVRAKAAQLRQVPPDARLLYVYGALVCDDNGHLRDEQMEEPWEPEAEAAARKMAAEFNLLGADN